MALEGGGHKKINLLLLLLQLNPLLKTVVPRRPGAATATTLPIPSLHLYNFGLGEWQFCEGK